MKEVYERIRRIRTEKGLSQEYVAEKLEMNQSNYGKIERGLYQLTIERLKQIAAVLNVNVYDILAPADPDFFKYVVNEKENIWIAFESRVQEEINKATALLQKDNESLRTEVARLSEQLEDKKQIIELLKK